jgi:hypothetical protein
MNNPGVVTINVSDAHPGPTEIITNSHLTRVFITSGICNNQIDVYLSASQQLVAQICVSTILPDSTIPPQRFSVDLDIGFVDVTFLGMELTKEVYRVNIFSGDAIIDSSLKLLVEVDDSYVWDID